MTTHSVSGKAVARRADLVGVQARQLAEAVHDVAEFCDVQAGAAHALLHLQKAQRRQHLLCAPAPPLLLVEQDPAGLAGPITDRAAQGPKAARMCCMLGCCSLTSGSLLSTGRCCATGRTQQLLYLKATAKCKTLQH